MVSSVVVRSSSYSTMAPLRSPTMILRAVRSGRSRFAQKPPIDSSSCCPREKSNPMRTYGRGRYLGGVYPQGPNGGAVVPPSTPGAVAFTQNADGFNITQGDPAEVIASVTITVQAGSDVKLEALVSGLGSVAAGRAFLTCADVAGVISSQSFDAAAGLNYRTLNYLGIVNGLAAGPHTFDLVLDLNGAAGANFVSAGAVCFVATELVNP